MGEQGFNSAKERASSFCQIKLSAMMAARVEGGESLTVSLELDTEKREVKAPADLVKALKAAPPAWDRWRELMVTSLRQDGATVDFAPVPKS